MNTPNTDPKKSTTDDNHLGISFNEIHSDEDHEAVAAATTEVTPPHTPHNDSHLTNHDDVFNVKKAFESDDLETGTIVSDHRRRRTTFGENIGAAFREWWGSTQETIHNTLDTLPGSEPDEVSVVGKAELRADIVKEAATNANFAPKDDHEAVIEKIHTYKQDVARARGTAFTIKEPSPQDKAKGNWSHTLYEDTEATQPPQATLEALESISDLREITIAPDVPRAVTKNVPVPKVSMPVPPPPTPRAPVEKNIPQPPIAAKPLPVVVPAALPSPESHTEKAIPAPVPPALRPAPKEAAPPQKPLPPPPPSKHRNITVNALPHTENENGLKTPFVSHKTFATKKPASSVFSSFQKLFETKPEIAKYTPPVVAAPATPKAVTPPSVPKSKSPVPVALPVAAAKSPTPVWSSTLIPASPNAQKPAQDPRVEVVSPIITHTVVPQSVPAPVVPKREESPLSPPPAPVPHRETPVAPITPPPIIQTPIPVPVPPSPPPAPQQEFRTQRSGVTPQKQKVEKNKPEQTPTYVAAPPNDTVRNISRYAILLGIAVFGVTLAVIASLYFNVFTKSEEPLSVPIQVPTFFSTKSQAAIPLEGDRVTFFAALREKIQNENEITQVYPTLVDAGTTRTATTEEVLRFLAIQLDTKTQRALSNTVMIGGVMTTKNEPFIVLQSYNFDVLFSGLLRWESFMYADLALLLGTPRTPQGSFVDAVRNNASTRILYDTEGTEILLYSFINQNTVVITTSGAALAKIITQF